MTNEKENDRSLTIKDILLIFKRNIIMFSLIVVIITVLGCVYVKTRVHTQYQSYASVYVDASKFNQNADNGDVSGAIRASETIAEGLIDRPFVEETIKKLEENGDIEKGLFTVNSFSNCLSKETSTTNYKISLFFKYTDPVICEKALNTLIEVSLASDWMFKDCYEWRAHAVEGSAAGPNKVLYCLIAFIASIVIGSAVVFIAEALKNKYKDENDVANALKINTIGVLADDKTLEANNNLSTMNKTNYERLLTNIDFSSVDNKLKVIQFTSTDQDDGKSTIVYNLAQTISDNSRKCLIIDLDLRNPSVHRFFKVERGKGITDVVTDQAPLDEVINNVMPNIDIISAGTKVLNPIVILQSDKIKEIIKSLKEKYDYIFLDCTPTFASSDAMIVSGFADATIFVLCANKTKISLSKKALLSLEKANIIGCILGRVKFSKNDYNYYYKNYNYGKQTNIDKK